MKNIVVLYNHETEWDKEFPLEKSPETRLSFEDFYEFARKEGYFFYRADIAWFKEESGCFERGWTFSAGAWSHVTEPITPHAVFDKVAGKYDYSLFDLKMGMSKKFAVINSPLFRVQFDNKFSQYLAFSEYMPKTFLAENPGQFKRALQKISTTQVVIKEPYGSGGNQVSIIGKESADPLSQPYPVLLQEFIQTAGIPDFSEKGSVADLRLVFARGELVYALSRIAKAGSLLTNFHQGAKAVLVPIEKIPASCLTLAKSINEKLFLFEGTNYSLDFMFTTDGSPLFIEMNTTPGFDLLRLVGTPQIKETYYRKLLSTFN